MEVRDSNALSIEAAQDWPLANVCDFVPIIASAGCTGVIDWDTASTAPRDCVFGACNMSGRLRRAGDARTLQSTTVVPAALAVIPLCHRWCRYVGCSSVHWDLYLQRASANGQLLSVRVVARARCSSGARRLGGPRICATPVRNRGCGGAPYDFYCGRHRRGTLRSMTLDD